MGKKQKKVTEQKQYESKQTDKVNEAGNNLANLLSSDILQKLKDTAQDLKQVEEQAKQKKADEDAAAKRAEQKKLENDFSYLLEHSDPKGHKYK